MTYGRSYPTANGVDDDLASFLAPLPSFAKEAANWGRHRFDLTDYLAEEQPPLRYVTSSRAVLIDGDDVLVVRDPGGNHVMPGGRLEAGESPEDALRRELLEETGWTIARLQRIGFRHFHHLTPEPPGWTYPYPNFIQVVYACAPGEYRPERMEPDEFVLGAEFVPIVEAKRLDLDAGQPGFLDAAVAALST